VSPACRRWNVRPKLTEAELTRWPDLPRLVVQLLHNRGVSDPDHMRRFLDCEPLGATDPLALRGMAEGVTRLQAAIRAGEPIAIFGDYDADGVTAAALLTQALRALGATLRPQPYIPDRVEEGYGLNDAALEKLASEGMRVVITVDCGVRSVKEAATARALGLDLIITDHHTPGEVLPEAVAVINPKQPGCAYPFKQLAGVGVAYKLAQALHQAHGREPTDEAWLDLVALGTVADVAPLVDENRALVARGLAGIKQQPPLGLKKLMETAGLAEESVTSHTIGYILAPRLNAAGRLESAYSAYELLMTEDEATATALAHQLHQHNIDRQQRTRDEVEAARRIIETDGGASPIYVVAEPHFEEGIVGLVAGRLTEEFYRPVLVARRGPDLTRGSARSIPEFHITRALDECADLLVRHGGHSAAAGFTVATQSLEALQERLLEIAAREMDVRTLEPTLDIDADLNLRAMDRAAVEDVLTARKAGVQDLSEPLSVRAATGIQVLEDLDRLNPHGAGNPQPVFASYGLAVRRRKTVGKDGCHLRLDLHDGRQTWEAICFNGADLCGQPGERVDVAYRLGTNDWDGRRHLQLLLEDVRHSD
jgi:single-stranded-DNA-specific exonuclease